jgi:hypothetical protein
LELFLQPDIQSINFFLLGARATTRSNSVSRGGIPIDRATVAVRSALETNNKQQTTNNKQQTANSKQQTANSKQQTANSKQQTSISKQNKYTTPREPRDTRGKTPHHLDERRKKKRQKKFAHSHGFTGTRTGASRTKLLLYHYSIHKNFKFDCLHIFFIDKHIQTQNKIEFQKSKITVKRMSVEENYKNLLNDIRTLRGRTMRRLLSCWDVYEDAVAMERHPRINFDMIRYGRFCCQREGVLTLGWEFLWYFQESIPLEEEIPMGKLEYLGYHDEDGQFILVGLAGDPYTYKSAKNFLRIAKSKEKKILQKNL